LEDNYYVYIYLDPTKKGNYIYNDFIFDYEPFYVGKGKGKRAYVHLSKYRNDNKHNKLKYNKISKILSRGKEPIILFYSENLTELDAFNLEILLIEKIGLRIYKQGPLTNLTKGGMGSAGHKSPKKGKTYDEYYGEEKSEEIRSKVGKYERTDKHREYAREHIENLQVIRSSHPTWNNKSRYNMILLNKQRKGTKHSEERKTRISKALLGDKNPFYGKQHTDETKKIISEKNKGKLSGGKNPAAITIMINGIEYACKKEAMAALDISYTLLTKRLSSDDFPNYLIKGGS